MKKVFPLILLFIGCNTQSQGGCGNGYIELDGNCYHEGDLRILQKLIDNNTRKVKSSNLPINIVNDKIHFAPSGKEL